jgi:hypothetical protein
MAGVSATVVYQKHWMRASFNIQIINMLRDVASPSTLKKQKEASKLKHPSRGMRKGGSRI